jgi:hypothetical protein
MPLGVPTLPTSSQPDRSAAPAATPVSSTVMPPTPVTADAIKMPDISPEPFEPLPTPGKSPVHLIPAAPPQPQLGSPPVITPPAPPEN